jgi:hypothetical protein
MMEIHEIKELKELLKKSKEEVEKYLEEKEAEFYQILDDMESRQ